MTCFRVLAFCMAVCLLFSTVSGRRRRRCYYHLCRKCDLYVHARYSRSVSETEELQSIPDDNLFPGAFREVSEDLDEKPPASDLKLIDDLNDSDFNRLISQMEKVEVTSETPPNHASHVQKRSTYSHLRRCILIIRTACCKRFRNPMFIGYAMKP